MRIESVEAIPAGGGVLRARHRRRRHDRRRRIDLLRLADGRRRDRAVVRDLPEGTRRLRRRAPLARVSTARSASAAWRSPARSAPSTRRSGTSRASTSACRSGSCSAARPGEQFARCASSTRARPRRSSRRHAEPSKSRATRALKILLFQHDHHLMRQARPARRPGGALRRDPGDRRLGDRPRRRAAPQHDAPATLSCSAASWRGSGRCSSRTRSRRTVSWACGRSRRKVAVPVAAGERNTTIWEFAEYLERPGVAFVRPDVGIAGGITHVKKICALAEAFNAGVLPHAVPSGPVAVAAHVQLGHVVPNWELQEHVPQDEAALDRHRRPRDRGARRLPDRARPARARHRPRRRGPREASAVCRSTSPVSPSARTAPWPFDDHAAGAQVGLAVQRARAPPVRRRRGPRTARGRRRLLLFAPSRSTADSQPRRHVTPPRRRELGEFAAGLDVLVVCHGAPYVSVEVLAQAPAPDAARRARRRPLRAPARSSRRRMRARRARRRHVERLVVADGGVGSRAGADRAAKRGRACSAE